MIESNDVSELRKDTQYFGGMTMSCLFVVDIKSRSTPKLMMTQFAVAYMSHGNFNEVREMKQKKMSVTLVSGKSVSYHTGNIMFHDEVVSRR